MELLVNIRIHSKEGSLSLNFFKIRLYSRQFRSKKSLRKENCASLMFLIASIDSKHRIFAGHEAKSTETKSMNFPTCCPFNNLFFTYTNQLFLNVFARQIFKTAILLGQTLRFNRKLVHISKPGLLDAFTG